MKLLFDENLARDLVRRVADVYPNAEHVAKIGLKRAGDRDVWEYARAHGFVIVSKDSDFNQLAFLHGAPPKIVWLRVGNCTTDSIERLLRGRASEIAAFVTDPDDAVLIVE